MILLANMFCCLEFQVRFFLYLLYKVKLRSAFLPQSPVVVTIGLTPSLPVRGCGILLGNDLGSNIVSTNPVVSEVPVDSDSTRQLEQEVLDCLPACVVTCSQTKKSSDKDRLMPLFTEDKTKTAVCEWGLEDTSRLYFVSAY